MSEVITTAEDRYAYTKVTLKITIYYLVVFGLVSCAITFAPGFLDILPVGGVSELSESSDFEIAQFEDALLSGDFDEEEFVTSRETRTPSSKFLFGDALNLLVSMIGCVLLMLPVSWVYRTIHRDGDHDHSLDETTLLLPTVVAGIVMVVQHSLALAFSLAGIVAGVQFRRALSDTFDTLFIFVSIAVGIAAGINALDIAAVLTVFFTYAALSVCLFGDGIESQHKVNQRRRKFEEKLELAKAKKQVTREDRGGTND